jgi:MFS transporter, DHA2 family, multidrug resistance protein
MLAMFLAEWLVEDPPYIKRNLKAAIDFIGFGLLAVWLATLQIVLDKGQEADWFGAVWIRWFMVISVVAMIAFIVWEFKPSIRWWICGFSKAGTSPSADVDDGHRHHPLRHDGGIAAVSADADGLSGAAKRYTDESARHRRVFHHVFCGAAGRARPLRWMLFRFFDAGLSSFMLSGINLQVSMASVIWPSVLNGVAISFIFVPLTTATMSQLRQQQIGNATGLYNLMLNLGGSIGIALVTTMVARGAQAHQALMVGHLTPTDPVFTQRLAAAQHVLARQTDPVTATHQAYALIYNTLNAAGAFVGVCGHVPGVRADGAVLPAADFPVQTGQRIMVLDPRQLGLARSLGLGGGALGVAPASERRMDERTLGQAFPWLRMG